MGKRYRVYFDQVNQTFYDVIASSKEEASKKAVKLWNRENKDPLPYVEEE